MEDRPLLSLFVFLSKQAFGTEKIFPLSFGGKIWFGLALASFVHVLVDNLVLDAFAAHRAVDKFVG